MKNARIFLVGDEATQLTPMIETPYSSEDILQILLAKYPDLMPGDQIAPESPRRWLLVGREIPVPGDEAETVQFYLDHLFLDQDGIPTFVECKRATDTRLRREVVAQMLDYAANGTYYWSINRLQEIAVKTADGSSQSLDDAIAQLIGTTDSVETENYWKQVESNLKAGKVRLIFVADEIPGELRRLVEFLNEKLLEIQVLAVEIKQFIGEGQKALVPRVIGLTEASRVAKPPISRKRPLTQDELLALCTPPAIQVFQMILNIAKEKTHRIYWGVSGISIRLYLPQKGDFASFAYCYPPNEFQFYFPELSLANDEEENLRTQLMASGVFKASGSGKTLRAAIEEGTVDRISEVYGFILTQMERIAQAQQEIN